MLPRDVVLNKCWGGFGFRRGFNLETPNVPHDAPNQSLQSLEGSVAHCSIS